MAEWMCGPGWSINWAAIGGVCAGIAAIGSGTVAWLNYQHLLKQSEREDIQIISRIITPKSDHGLNHAPIPSLIKQGYQPKAIKEAANMRLGLGVNEQDLAKFHGRVDADHAKAKK